MQDQGRHDIQLEIPNSINRDVSFLGDDAVKINQTLANISLAKDQADDIGGRFNSSVVKGTTLFPFVSEALESGKLLLNSISVLKTVGTIIESILGTDGVIKDVLIAILTLSVILAIILIVSGRATQ